MQKKKKKKHKFFFTLICLAAVLGAFFCYEIYVSTHYDVSYYEVNTSNAKEDLRIVFISDMHLNEYGNDNESLINDIKDLKPNLIITGGDLATYGVENYDGMLSLCNKLSKIAPLYGVLGNHEDEKIFLGNETDLPDKFENAGLNLLRNEQETVSIGKNRIEIIGVEGSHENFEQYGAKEFMDNLKVEPSAIKVCIAHTPQLFKDSLKNYDFDLGLSGHYHGGIVQIPNVGGLFTKDEGFFPSVSAGKYDIENKTVIVSRGMGDQILTPRINNNHELAVIDIK